jgi:heterodisulfide reductase subunit B
MEKRYNVSYKLPVLYITEVIGLALGLSPRRLGLHRHIVSLRPVLDRLGHNH